MSQNFHNQENFGKKKISEVELIKNKENNGELRILEYFLYNSLPNKDFHFNGRILSKTAIINFFEKYLELILKKGGRATGKQNIEYYLNIINKFLNQEEGEILAGKQIKEIKSPMKYGEFQDFSYIINTLGNLKFKDFNITEPEEKERIVGIITSIDRIIKLREQNGTKQNLIDPKINTLKNLQLARLKTINIILSFEDQTIEKNPNKDFVGPKLEYEKRLDKYFKHIFFACANKASNKSSYYRELYLRITNYNENTKITTEELGIFIEFINKLDIDIFTRESIGDIMSLEEISKIFEKGINNGFLNYILPKVFKIKISKLCRKQNEKILNGEEGGLMNEISTILENNEEYTEYSFKSQLNADKIPICEGIEICSIGEKHYRMNYLVRNGKIIAEFKWGDIYNIEDYNGRKTLRIMLKNKYTHIYLFNGEAIGGRFDDISGLEDGVDGDKVFRASKDGKEMYISLKTGKPIGGEYFSVGKIQDGVDGDKVFKVTFEQRNENYISMRSGKTITKYPGYFMVSDIKKMPFGEKYFEFNIISTNAGGMFIELDPKITKINLRTGQEVDLLELTQFELKRRLNTLLTYLG